MRDDLGAVQRVLVLGGTSEIAEAIVTELAGTSRLQDVVLACREPASAEPVVERLGRIVDSVRVVAFDLVDPDGHDRVMAEAASVGDIDAIVLAAGALGDADELLADPIAAHRSVEVNAAGTIAAAVAAAGRLRAQGHGQLVVLSSVAGVRVRSSNAVYGAGKAALDGFALALGDSLHGTGVHVLVVRPGFVHTRMTEGLDPAPFSTDAATVARITVEGMRSGRTVVWAPKPLRFVFAVFRLLPAPLWRIVSAQG